MRAMTPGRRVLRPMIWAVAAALLSGCQWDGPADDAAAPALDAPMAPQLHWEPRGSVAVGPTGLTEAVRVTFQEGRRFTAVRASWDEDVEGDLAAPRCVQVHTATDHRGDPVALPETLVQGPDVALFVFDAVTMASAQTIDLRLSVVDCGLGMPAHLAGLELPSALNVELATDALPEVPQSHHLAVRVGVVAGSLPLDGPLQDDPNWQQAWSHATEVFATMGLELHLEGVVTLGELSQHRVTFEPGHRGDADAVFAEFSEALSEGSADHRFVPVIIAPCLDVVDPIKGAEVAVAGWTPRIPGHHHGTSLGGVWIGVGSCPDADWTGAYDLWTDPVRAGGVLAHELGHYLGLLHDGGSERLMNAAILTHAGHATHLTQDEQRRILSHPDVWTAP